jgi:hypothetical protein
MNLVLLQLVEAPDAPRRISREHAVETEGAKRRGGEIQRRRSAGAESPTASAAIRRLTAKKAKRVVGAEVVAQELRDAELKVARPRRIPRAGNHEAFALASRNFLHERKDSNLRASTDARDHRNISRSLVGVTAGAPGARPLANKTKPAAP